MRATIAYEPFSTRVPDSRISLCVPFADPANQYKREHNTKPNL